MTILSKLDRANRASRVLIAFLQDRNARLRFGARVRKSTLDQLKAGTHPDNYRMVWLNDTSHKVLNMLNDAAQAFNGRYVWDMVQPQDMLDVLRHVATHFAEDKEGNDE